MTLNISSVELSLVIRRSEFIHYTISSQFLPRRQTRQRTNSDRIRLIRICCATLWGICISMGIIPRRKFQLSEKNRPEMNLHSFKRTKVQLCNKIFKKCLISWFFNWINNIGTIHLHLAEGGTSFYWKGIVFKPFESEIGSKFWQFCSGIGYCFSLTSAIRYDFWKELLLYSL